MTHKALGNIIEGEARGLIGVPFKHQGRSPEAGLDCLGLLVHIAEKLSLTSKDKKPLANYDIVTYSKSPNENALQNTLRRTLLDVAITSMQAGDIALMSYDNIAQHLGIISTYSATPKQFGLIHAYAPARKVTHHHLDNSWLLRIHSLHRASASIHYPLA